MAANGSTNSTSPELEEEKLTTIHIPQTIQTIIFPDCLVLKNGQIFNVLTKTYISNNLQIQQPHQHLIFDPLELSKIAGDVNLSSLTNMTPRKRNEALGFYTPKKWEFSLHTYRLANSHTNHCLSPQHGTSCRKALRTTGLLRPGKDEAYFCMVAKYFQKYWLEFEDKVRCGFGNDCEHEDSYIHLPEERFSVDLELQRGWIIETLTRLRQTEGLDRVCTSRVLKLLMDPREGNIRLVHNDENKHRGKATDEIIHRIQALVIIQ